MVTVKNGGPAFPRQLPDIKVPIGEAVEVIERYSGMSLRDWFAGQALTGWMSEIPNNTSWPIDAAKQCYAVADAMLAARGANP